MISRGRYRGSPIVPYAVQRGMFAFRHFPVSKCHNCVKICGHDDLGDFFFMFQMFDTLQVLFCNVLMIMSETRFYRPIWDLKISRHGSRAPTQCTSSEYRPT